MELFRKIVFLDLYCVWKFTIFGFVNLMNCWTERILFDPSQWDLVIDAMDRSSTLHCFYVVLICIIPILLHTSASRIFNLHLWQPEKCWLDKSQYIRCLISCCYIIIYIYIYIQLYVCMYVFKYCHVLLHTFKYKCMVRCIIQEFAGSIVIPKKVIMRMRGLTASVRMHEWFRCCCWWWWWD